ncbi:abscission/NoCut checkpoint regulator [Cephus cinctus]|uniref:Abscission/NoCut checkpoint regulator n=1 Tax=Cephus cinctus TaxID=211228 RepID=A0AAJ7BPL1_CEPCN|nr:abscission/NoCut checkpoint regulator [Cephus cinctus]
MSCNSCQTKYSFFTHENACPKCGFSYCSKCLKYKCHLPNVGTKKICGPCYNKLQFSETKKTVTPVSDLSPPEGLDSPLIPIDITKKLDALENPSKPPITMYKQGTHWDKFKTGLEPADQEIVDRLRKLKDEDKQVPAPSVEEIRHRLALLKDQDPDKVPEKGNIYKEDTRSDQQKTNDLISEYLDTLKLSAGKDPYQEIQARLDHLRDIDPSKSTVKHDDSDDEDTVTKKLIKKALSEAVIEAKYQDVDELEDMEIEAVQGSCDEDEAPSCVMCEETKQLLVCSGCNNDLYCPACFEENHADFELHKHKIVPLKLSKKPTMD